MYIIKLIFTSNAQALVSVNKIDNCILVYSCQKNILTETSACALINKFLNIYNALLRKCMHVQHVVVMIKKKLQI
jgi:hypothetical protein